MDTLPVLSLKKLQEIDVSNSDNAEHKRLYDICLEHGFFYLKDHGISQDLVQKTIDASRNFFELPEAIKQQYAQDKQTVYPKISRGYSPLYGETLNGNFGPDPKELFDLGIEHPPSDKPFTGPNLIPDDTVAPDFAKFQYQLQGEILSKIVPHLLRALAVALNLEPNWFDPYFDDPVLIHRTIYYPSESGFAGKHTDLCMFTILIQEYFSTPSLRVYTQNNWLDAMCLEDAFVVNLGDLLQLWTNGLFVSTPHEVIHKNPTSRISIPFFVHPNIDTVVQPIGTNQKFKSMDIMLKSFNAIWVTKEGSGRVKELK